MRSGADLNGKICGYLGPICTSVITLGLQLGLGLRIVVYKLLEKVKKCGSIMWLKLTNDDVPRLSTLLHILSCPWINSILWLDHILLVGERPYLFFFVRRYSALRGGRGRCGTWRQWLWVCECRWSGWLRQRLTWQHIGAICTWHWTASCCTVTQMLYTVVSVYCHVGQWQSVMCIWQLFQWFHFVFEEWHEDVLCGNGVAVFMQRFG